MASNDQVKPLAPSGYQIGSDPEDEAIMSSKTPMLHRRRCLQCWGCITAVLLVLIVIIIVIATVYQIKHPIIKMNSVTIQGLELLNNGSIISSGENVRLIADVSVKNPNYNSFKYSNTTTSIYYGGVVVGEGHIPPGLAKARRTLRMNLTVDIIPEKILTAPSLRSDVLNMSSYTRIAGKIKILNIVKKSVGVKMNCTFTYSISSQAVQDNCWRQG